MTIEFNCPECHKLLRTADDKAGARAKCPDCGASLSVPQSAPPTAVTADDEFDYGGDYGSPPPNPSAGAFAALPSAGSSAPPPIPPAGGTKKCPMCGEEIKAAAVRCRFCGENLGAAPETRGVPSWVKPHRGGLILAFAIISFVFTCPFFSIAAWIMGSGDLKQMAAGTMDPSGEGMTKAGKIVAMVQVGLTCVILLFYCVMFGIMMAAGEFN